MSDLAIWRSNTPNASIDPICLFLTSNKKGHTVRGCCASGQARMPFELPLPDSCKPWKVKIFDNELLCEEPHVTIVFKTTRWRYSLRSRKMLDKQPDPKDVGNEILAEIRAKHDVLCREWDARFPTNPVTGDEEERS